MGLIGFTGFVGFSGFMGLHCEVYGVYGIYGVHGLARFMQSMLLNRVARPPQIICFTAAFIFGDLAHGWDSTKKLNLYSYWVLVPLRM